VQTLFARLNMLSMEQLETQFQQVEAEGRTALLVAAAAAGQYDRRAGRY
jgi:hypothetical protein